MPTSDGETLTDVEVASLRETTERWFTDKCDIYRIAVGDDPYGGEDETESLVSGATGVECMLESGAAHEQTRAVYGKIVGVQLFTVTLPALTDVRVGDHLLITTQGNLHLRVQAVMDPESWELERRVIGSEEGEHEV
jgi:hypothetical protein